MPPKKSSIAPTSASNRAIGRLGESLAVEFLHQRGYVIVDRNWRGGNAELDIVARMSDVVVFIEVKARRSLSRGLPVEAITPSKIEHIKRAALAWLNEHKQTGRIIRFDAISILIVPNGNHQISHFVGIDV